MESDDQYDEFGNYLGDAPASSDNESIELENDAPEALQSEHALVTLDERFKGAETTLVNPTETGRDEPVIKPSIEHNFSVDLASDLPVVSYSREYMLETARALPERIRNIAVVGTLHSGKTSIVDCLVHETHPEVSLLKKDRENLKTLRYLDTLNLEIDRGVSMTAGVMTFLASDTRERSHILNVFDCPGHADFQDETRSALEAVEGAVLVLDIVEGLTKPDKRRLTDIMRKNLPFVLVLNKIDRLILELRLPTRDFNLKLKSVLADVNAYIHHNEFAESYTHEKLVSPLLHNVVFSSAALGVNMTLDTFSRMYKRKGMVHVENFRQYLWGDVAFNAETKKFSKLNSPLQTSSFEVLVLEPLYKLFSLAITAEPKDEAIALVLWENFGVQMDKALLSSRSRAFLREVFTAVFPLTSDLVDLIVKSIPAPPADSAPTSAIVTSTRFSSDAKSVYHIVRVLLGTLSAHQVVRFLENDSESLETVESLFVSGGRYLVPVSELHQGMVGVIFGAKGSISKSTTLYAAESSLNAPLHFTKFGETAVYKVAIEPESPTELPRLTDALKSLSVVYMSSVVKREESGEFVVLAPGELYLDCFLHDIRYLFGEYLSIKVSDPMTRFGESCGERSATKISALSASKKYSMSITAEPVNDKKLTKAIESGRLDLSQPAKITSRILTSEFGWDSLAARSVWCFGPSDMQNPSILLDDTLEDEVDKSALVSLKEVVTSGFKLAVNEGPLCDEPIRNTKFKILDVVLASKGLKSSGSQVIPMTRNATHIGLLTASPRLLEPTYRVNVICTYDSIEAVHSLLDKRRGWAVSETPIPATPLFELEGFVPVADSIGFDTDIRIATQGQAMCSLTFARWDVVPGDPLDTECYLPAMKPVPRASLARDFVMKTRRRKGLSGEPNLQKYIDADLYARLRESGIVN